MQLIQVALEVQQAARGEAVEALEDGAVGVGGHEVRERGETIEARGGVVTAGLRFEVGHHDIWLYIYIYIFAGVRLRERLRLGGGKETFQLSLVCYHIGVSTATFAIFVHLLTTKLLAPSLSPFSILKKRCYA